MNHQILDSLIQDESIRSLLEKSADAYWLSEIYDYNLGISNNEQEILVRLAVLYTTLSLSEESKNTKNLEYAYKLLLTGKFKNTVLFRTTLQFIRIIESPFCLTFKRCIISR